MVQASKNHPLWWSNTPQ